MTRTYTTEDWLDSICNLKELLSLTENELVQLEEIDGDLALKAAFWRRRRRRAYPTTYTSAAAALQPLWPAALGRAQRGLRR